MQIKNKKMTFQEILLKAKKEGWATGHFNASESDHMRAIVGACFELKSPVVIGTSEGEREHLGLLEAVALRDAFREEFDISIFLNADHTKNVENAKKAIDAGYDSIHIDLSALTYEENMKGTKEIVGYARDKEEKENVILNIEGELGYLKGESKIEKEKVEISRDDYTKPEEAKNFVEETGVNRLAVAVGNIHGLSPEEPEIDMDLIAEIRKSIPENVALVLHAGSGISDEKIRRAIEAGISNIHINTDLRVAYVGALREKIKKDKEETAMYKLDLSAFLAMKEVVKSKLALFGAVGRV